MSTRRVTRRGLTSEPPTTGEPAKEREAEDGPPPPLAPPPPRTTRARGKTSTVSTTSSTTTTTTANGGSSNRKKGGNKGGGGGVTRNSRKMLNDVSIVYSQKNAERGESSVIYFVLPEGTTQANCSPNLTTVFVIASDAGIVCEWMSEEKCLGHTPLDGNVFILDPYHGRLLDYLLPYKEKRQCFILGPQVLRCMIEEPEISSGIDYHDSPFTIGMKNLLVCISGVTNLSRKAELVRKIKLMLGEVSNAFTKGVTHVVAEHMLTDKVITAAELKVPVMKTEWVDQVFTDSQSSLIFATNEKYVSFYAPMFHNLSICLSQIPNSLKNALCNVITDNGGKYSPDLKKDTSLLIVPKPEGDKYNYAVQWKIPCVVPGWVEACKDAGHIVKWKDHDVAVIKRKDSTPEVNREKHRSSKKKEKESDIVVTSTPINSMNRVPLNAENCTFLSGIDGSSFSRDPNLPGAPTELLPKVAEILKKVEDIGQFLDGLSIYISKALKSDDVRKLVDFSGAIRQNSATDRITHVLLPLNNQLSHEEIQIFKQLDSRPYFVKLEWLIESAKQKVPAGEDDYKITFEDLKNPNHINSNISRIPESVFSDGDNMSIESLVENSSKRSHNSKSDNHSKTGGSSKSISKNSSKPKSTHSSAVEFAPGLEFEMSANLFKAGSVVHIETNAVTIDGVRHPGVCMEMELAVENDSDTTPDLIFTQLRFKVVMPDPKEQSEVELCLTKGGGELSAEEYDVIILPPIYSSDLVINPKSQLRTKQWIFDCIEKGICSLSDTLYCYKPMLSFPGVEKIFQDIVVAISVYPSGEKEYLSDLILGMGGKYQDVFAKKDYLSSNPPLARTTHLICPKTDNPKYIAALKWKTPVVIAEWVVDCFKFKVKLDLAPYDPALKTDSASSQSGVDYFPRTPKAVKSSKKQENGGMVAGVFKIPTSTERRPIVKRQVETTPSSPATPPPNFNSPAAASTPVPYLQTPSPNTMRTESFLAYHEAHKDDDLNTASFLEWKAQQPPPPEDDPKDHSSILEAERWGITRDRYRDVRFERMLMNMTPPWQKEKKGIPIIRKRSTPAQVMIDRDLDKLKGKYPPFQPSPVVARAKYNNGGDISAETSSSSKRKSDTSMSSVDNEEPQPSSSLESGLPKRLRLSDGNESIPTTSSKVETPLSTTNDSKVSDDGDDETEDSSEGEEEPTPNPKASIQNLKNLLAEEPTTRRYIKPIKRTPQQNNFIHDEEEPSDEEMVDAPHVVWDDAGDPVLQLPEPGSGLEGDNDEEDESENEELDGAVAVANHDHSFSIRIPNSPQPDFILSGLSDARKNELIDKLSKLGAEPSGCQYFNPVAVALVADSLARSEKVLCAIASGKPILKSKYIDDCASSKKFLPITKEYLLKEEDVGGKPKINEDIERDLAKAAQIWFYRIRSDTTDRPFQNEKIFIYGVKDDARGTKMAAYVRLVSAGGGEVVTSKRGATLVLLSDPSRPPSDIGDALVENFKYLHTKIIYCQ